MNSKTIAIITARGGSKRIPKKNINIFCGKPIIQYSIEAALESKIFDEVMVSTDDNEIKEIALKCGAKVPFLRSMKNSNDMAMTHEVVLEVLNQYKNIGMEYKYACCIYPTAPFITAEKLFKAKELLIERDVDAVIPVVEFSFPPLRGFIIEEDKLEFRWPENKLVRSQDLKPMYHDCGQFYFVKTESFLNEKSLLMRNTLPIVMKEMEVQDIDNEEDWKVAELKYERMKRKDEE